ncbi:MAG: ArnT family glycosyltransferase [Microgenomates group bacterium]
MFSKIKSLIIKNYFFILILLAGAFLRFYRLEEFAQFLSDQGRDAIIVKRIITLEHLPAIGPPTSIGQVYLGPFYYYFIAPWLLIFNFNPAGLAFAVALFSCIFIFLSYWLIKKIFNQKLALFFSLFNVFSFILIDFSRFSWNPNLLPYFTFLSVYFFLTARNTNKILYYLLSGTFLSFSIQLHYLALTLIPPITFLLLKDLITNFRKQINKVLLFFLSFSFFNLPLLIFDLRHNFLNLKSFIKLFQTQSNAKIDYFDNLKLTFAKLNEYLFNTKINDIWLIALLVLIISVLFICFKKKNQIWYFLYFFLSILFSLSFYSGPKHAHYFGVIFPFYLLILSYFLSFISDFNWGKILVIVFFLAFTFLNYQNYYFLFKPPSNQILHAKKVADFLAQKIEGKPFNIATWPVEFFEDSYLYFLELKNLRPANRQKIEITNQMFVLCAKEPCQIINSPSWNISMFGKAKIDKIWEYEGLKIYKLIHQ